jgi:hypothetical protein
LRELREKENKQMSKISPEFSKNLRAAFEPGFREALARVPAIREEKRLRYLADSTAYRREKYACRCYMGRGTQAGNLLLSPSCPVHNKDFVDFHPEYRHVDPPASFIEKEFGPSTMADCFREKGEGR